MESTLGFELVDHLADGAVHSEHGLAVADHRPTRRIKQQGQLLDTGRLVRDVCFVVVRRVVGWEIGAPRVADVLRHRCVRKVQVVNRQDREQRRLRRCVAKSGDSRVGYELGGVNAFEPELALLRVDHVVLERPVRAFGHVELGPAGIVLQPLLRSQQVVPVQVLADEHRGVPGILHRLTDVLRGVEQQRVVGGHSVVVRVQAGQQVGARRAAQRVFANCAGELDALLNELFINIRGASRIVPEPAVVGRRVVDVEDDDVGTRGERRGAILGNRGARQAEYQYACGGDDGGDASHGQDPPAAVTASRPSSLNVSNAGRAGQAQMLRRVPFISGCRSHRKGYVPAGNEPK